MKLLNRFQLSATCSLGLPAEAHAPDHPEEAVRFLVTAIDTAADIGSEWLTGALYGHLGHLTGAAPSSGEIDTIAMVLRTAADHARARGIRLGIEIINRYETHLVNSAAQAADLLDRIDRPDTVFGHLDTFHMNLEEPDVREAIHILGPRLGYVHLAESNRGPIGSGLFPFRSFFDALNEIGFSGPAIIETFINAPPDLRSATASWRPVAGDPATFVSESLGHIESLLRAT
jgi:D-psicose/D-tagatose/L-ribulose 3-epimerase